MTRKIYIFNNKIFPTIRDAWLSIPIIQRKISYSYFSKNRPKTTYEAINKSQRTYNSIEKRRVLPKKYINYLETFEKIIEKGGPENIMETRLLDICFKTINKFRFPPISPEKDKKIIPSHENFIAAKYILNQIPLINTDTGNPELVSALASLKEAAEKEIKNYNSRSGR